MIKWNGTHAVHAQKWYCITTRDVNFLFRLFVPLFCLYDRRYHAHSQPQPSSSFWMHIAPIHTHPLISIADVVAAQEIPFTCSSYKIHKNHGESKQKCHIQILAAREHTTNARIVVLRWLQHQNNNNNHHETVREMWVCVWSGVGSSICRHLFKHSKHLHQMVSLHKWPCITIGHNITISQEAN